jgi:hypothetical protein
MGNWEPIWIASLEISPRIEQKIQAKHGIDADDLRWHLVCNSRVLGRTHRSHKHGSRTMVFALLADRKYLVAYLDLIDDYYSASSLRTAQVTSQIPIVGR